MATFTFYNSPYAAYEKNELCYESVVDPQFQFQQIPVSSIDPALRATPANYAVIQHDLFSSVNEPLQSFPSAVNDVNLANPTNMSQFNPYEQRDLPMYYNGPQDSPYHSPADLSGGNFSDESSDYGWGSDVSRLAPPFGNVQAETFKFAPLPSDSQSSQQSGWSADSGFALTPAGEVGPRLQSIAMKELEVQSSGDASCDQQLLEDRMSSVNIQFTLQPTPEELDLSESVAALTPLHHTSTVSSHSGEFGEVDCLSTGHSPQSESDLGRFYGSSLKAHLSPSHVQPVSHSRANSTASARSGRNLGPGHPILDAHSRIHKGRPSKSSSPAQPVSKDKSRLKGAHSKSTTNDHSRGDKQAKLFPCTFHLFGCPATFGNKNEWKRHVYSQHLRLSFYRCDMGNCNPEYNPKLIVPAGRPPASSLKYDTDENEEEEEENDLVFNDFNRKDLFTQHCRRMHGPHRYETDNTTLTNNRINARLQRQHGTQSHGGSSKSKQKAVVTKEDEAAFEIELEDIRSRCRILRRKAPARTSCGFCGKLFEVESGHGLSRHDHSFGEEGKAEERVWEERMEHIGRHYERDGSLPHLENIDDDLVEWGLSVGILQHVVDAEGITRPWLAELEVRKVPVHGDENEANETRITGIRHKSEQKRAGLRSKKDPPVTLYRKQPMLSESDDDASAEEE